MVVMGHLRIDERYTLAPDELRLSDGVGRRLQSPFAYKTREVNNNMTVAFFLTSDLIIQTIATDRAHNSASVVILLMPLNK